MALHHRREIADMRQAYVHEKTDERRYPSESGSERSYLSSSDRSYQTQPTSYSGSPPKRAPQIHYHTSDSRHDDEYHRYFDDRQPQESPRASVETYASTIPSQEGLAEILPDCDVPPPLPSYNEPSSIATTPSEFSSLFPSTRSLMLQHDDSTLDGNMNLRVDTKVSFNSRDCQMTLFHLRMHDLKNREFSLRRYCRDSGREVCHSVRKHQKPAAERRPGFHRSLSNALQSMRPKPERRSSAVPTLASLKRNDSGYGSMYSNDFDEDDRPKSSGDAANQQETPPTNSIKLEFSNYAQVEVKRTGVKGSKRYEFEYWGTHYAWKRVVRKDGGLKEIEYHLTKAGSDRVLAFIVPIPITSRQAQEDKMKGGWISPCSMWISDEHIVRAQKDIADVVVSTGLMALVDDSIRSHFHSKDSRQLLIPVPKLSMGVEYVGPKRLINEMFSRKESGSHSRPTSSGGRTSSSTSTTSTRRAGGAVRQSSYAGY